MDGLIKALPSAATSPYALIAYVAALICFMIAGQRLREVREVRRILKEESSSKKKRNPDLKSIIATATGRLVPPKVSGEVFLAAQRQNAILLISITAMLLIAGVIVVGIVHRHGGLYVDCDREADVYVGDERQGPSARYLSLNAGEHVITCRSADGIETRATFKVSPGENQRVALPKPANTARSSDVTRELPVLRSPAEGSTPLTTDVAGPMRDSISSAPTKPSPLPSDASTNQINETNRAKERSKQNTAIRQAQAQVITDRIAFVPTGGTVEEASGSELLVECADSHHTATIDDHDAAFVINKWVSAGRHTYGCSLDGAVVSKGDVVLAEGERMSIIPQHASANPQFAVNCDGGQPFLMPGTYIARVVKLHPPRFVHPRLSKGNDIGVCIGNELKPKCWGGLRYKHLLSKWQINLTVPTKRLVAQLGDALLMPIASHCGTGQPPNVVTFATPQGLLSIHFSRAAETCGEWPHLPCVSQRSDGALP